MGIRRILGLVIFIVGMFLLIIGIRSTHGINEKIVNEVKGRYTNETLWYIIGGSALIIVGGSIIIRKD